MQEYDKLIALTDSEEVREGRELPKVQLHKWLVLGQTEYVCRFGTLSDGHEKITDSQRYAQAIKEQYYISLAIADEKACGMEAQADLLDAEEALSKAETQAERLRAQAKIDRAKSRVISSLVNVEDRMRMLKTYRQVAAELKPIVEAKYPKGIEQAELDNWIAVAEYRRQVEITPGMQRQLMHNVPLDPETKAALGVAWQRPDMMAPLLVGSPEKQGLIETKLKALESK